MSIKLSIIVPVYNAEKYLYKNVMTLIQQTISSADYEIILINDGSKDASSEICFQLSQDYSNIILISQKNSGVSVARNAGIEKARGHYITFVDSDDYVCPEYVETIFELVDEEKEFYILDNFIVEDHIKGSEKQWLLELIKKRYTIDDVLSYLCSSRINAPWDKIYLKSVIKSHDLKFEVGLNMGEDVLFNLKYASYVNNVKVSDLKIYYHTVNFDGLCHKKVTFRLLHEYQIVYKKMMSIICELRNGEIHQNELRCAFLRLLTNYSGKLEKSGFSPKEIKAHFEQKDFFEEVVSAKYKSPIDCVRKFLLRRHLYKINAILFNN